MYKSKVLVVLLIAAAMFLTGCSEELADIQIYFDSLSVLEWGDEVELTAVGKTKFNMDAELVDVEWSVSDDSVAKLEPNDTTATLIAVGEGEVTVTAASGDISGSVTFTIMAGIPDPVVFKESFEDFAEGEYAPGWIVVNKEAHDKTGYSGGRISAEKASDGEKSVKLISVPDVEGRVEIEFGEPLLYHSLTVDLLQVESHKENVNLELHCDEGRLFGLFITGSGNVRYRHPDGSNGSNITAISNDSWHTIEFQWNDAEKIYKAFAISGSQRVEVTPPGGSSYELEFIDGQVTKFSVAITKRDDDKIVYIDNIEVIDLAVQEMLSK